MGPAWLTRPSASNIKKISTKTCAVPPPTAKPGLTEFKRRPRPGAAMAKDERGLPPTAILGPAAAARSQPALPGTRSLRAPSPPTQKPAARAPQPGHRALSRGSAVRSRSGVRGDGGAARRGDARKGPDRHGVLPFRRGSKPEDKAFKATVRGLPTIATISQHKMVRTAAARASSRKNW